MTVRSEANRIRMRGLAVEFPEQLTQGFRIGQELDVRLPSETPSALIVGMGGSAIAGDLLEGITRAEIDWTLGTIRGPDLPRSTPPTSLVLFVSYSGNTWETLAAYDAARRRGLPCVVVSSGGELARRAERDGVAHAAIPPGLPPRAALGLILGVLTGILDPAFPESYEGRLSTVASRLKGRQSEFASPKGSPAGLARRVGHRTPTILAPSEFRSVARRWMTQIEENAKRIAHTEELPEAMHNALVAWDAMDRTTARRQAILRLDFHPRAPPGPLDPAYLERLLSRRGIRVERVDVGSDERMEAILTAVSLGDHFSLFLAEQGGVDPLEIRTIERFKLAGGRR
jgi:glucose/mannose-6-phosphate isomerase